MGLMLQEDICSFEALVELGMMRLEVVSIVMTADVLSRLFVRA